jgi:hypothetical protein
MAFKVFRKLLPSSSPAHRHRKRRSSKSLVLLVRRLGLRWWKATIYVLIGLLGLPRPRALHRTGRFAISCVAMHLWAKVFHNHSHAIIIPVLHLCEVSSLLSATSTKEKSLARGERICASLHRLLPPLHRLMRPLSHLLRICHRKELALRLEARALSDGSVASGTLFLVLM